MVSATNTNFSGRPGLATNLAGWSLQSLPLRWDGLSSRKFGFAAQNGSGCNEPFAFAGKSSASTISASTSTSLCLSQRVQRNDSGHWQFHRFAREKGWERQLLGCLQAQQSGHILAGGRFGPFLGPNHIWRAGVQTRSCACPDSARGPLRLESIEQLISMQ